jgi:hypothetical protein
LIPAAKAPPATVAPRATKAAPAFVAAAEIRPIATALDLNAFPTFADVACADIPTRRIDAANGDISAPTVNLRSERVVAMRETRQKHFQNQPLAFSNLFVHSCGMDTKVLFSLVLRHALTIAGGYATGTGMINESDLTTGVGAVTAIVGIGMSVFDKIKAKRKAQGK